MSEKLVTVPIQYVLHTSVQTFTRPYELKVAVQNTVQLWLDIKPLPQENHWSLILEALVQGRTPEGVLCMETNCAIEAITVTAGLSEDETQQALKLIAAPAVLGSVRALLTSLTQGTGLGSVVLPPIQPEVVGALAPKSPN